MSVTRREPLCVRIPEGPDTCKSKRTKCHPVRLLFVILGNTFTREVTHLHIIVGKVSCHSLMFLRIGKIIELKQRIETVSV